MSVFFHRLVLPFLLTFLTVWGANSAAPPQQSGSGWSPFENISNSSVASTYPAAIGDREGNLHVVWAEDYGGRTSNLIYNPDGTPQLDYRGKQVNLLTDIGNTLTYSRWDGEKWQTPTDIHVAGAGRIQFPSITVDPFGTLHVIWLSGTNREQDLYYSSAPVKEAGRVRSWSRPTVLAGDILSAYYPASITADSTGGLQILFFKIGTNPGVFSISSTDSGDNWTAPVMVFANNSATGDGDGSLPVRMTIDDQDRLHATWSRFDRSGNGRTIFYAQSLDQGLTWSEPFEVAAWRQGMYEVDWISANAVGDRIHVVWEGGTQAYLNERISYDGGQTWTPEQIILPGLVGENGWADLVNDGENRMHIVVTKRIGHSGFTVYGTWHAAWQDGQWSAPSLVGFSGNNIYEQINVLPPTAIQSMLHGTIMGDGLRYQRSVILNGNELTTVVVNEYDGELYSSHILLPAKRVEAPPFFTEVPQPTLTATLEKGLDSTPTPLPVFDNDPVVFTDMNALIWGGIAPALVFVLGFLFVHKFFHQRKL